MASRKARRVLVVEDEYIVALEAEDLLAELGYVVVAAAPTLNDALLAAQAKKFDCAILDVNLGGELSYPIAEMLTERGVPFIFATAYPTYTIDHGYRHVPKVQKPFDGRSLGAAIEEALNGR